MTNNITKEECIDAVATVNEKLDTTSQLTPQEYIEHSNKDSLTIIQIGVVCDWVFASSCGSHKYSVDKYSDVWNNMAV